MVVNAHKRQESTDWRIKEVIDLSWRKFKVQILEYTQVCPEKGWFCMLIFHFLHCIVHVTFKLEDIPTHTQMCRGYVDFINNPRNLKVEKLDSTQVPSEKGWFCMLIFQLLHCIVHVTPTFRPPLTPTQMCRGYVDFINNPRNFKF